MKYEDYWILICVKYEVEIISEIWRILNNEMCEIGSWNNKWDIKNIE